METVLQGSGPKLYAAGVTATRNGLSPAQIDWLEDWVWAIDVLHHGDCVGGDEQIHNRVRAGRAWADGPPARIVVHPGTRRPDLRAHCEGDEIREPKDEIARNHDIVDESAVVLAFPKEKVEQPRGSGTWATIRYAKKVGRHLYVFYPDGTYEKFNMLEGP